jgi:long-chain-fatty-acid--CoA ligase ACSBG
LKKNHCLFTRSLSQVPDAKDMFKPTEAEQGELCYRGRNVMMGYLANPDLGPEHVADVEKKTKETIDKQGWLHSGDKGCRDARGMFRITGRYKELLIGAGGENVAPVPVEDCIKALCPAISNVMMVGDKMPFNCALVTLKCVGANGELPGSDQLDGEALAYQDSVCQPGDAKAATVGEACKPGSALAKAIMAAIVATNKNEDACPMNAAKVQKFMILPLDFAVATDDFTPTFKLKRAAVHARFDAQIQHMYASKEDYVPFPSALK